MYYRRRLYVDLQCKDNDTNTNFINNLHIIGLHPIISFPTRVTDHSATLLDNFLCDINLLPINSTVIKTNTSNYYMIEQPIIIKITPSNIIMRNLSEKNKNNFYNKIQNVNWTPMNDTDAAFNYFIKKIKRIYNKYFLFESQIFKHKPNPWLTADILKSIKIY